MRNGGQATAPKGTIVNNERACELPRQTRSSNLTFVDGLVIATMRARRDDVGVNVANVLY